jgi:single-strand DNA-binding protein
MNKAIIQGRIGKQPEIRTFENGGSIATFSVATNEGYYDKNNTWVERTEWHNVVYPGRSADKVSAYPAGTEVLVDGKIRTREYEKPNGEKARTTEIVAKTVKAFGLKKQEAEQSPGIAQSAQEEPGEDFSNSDDLPF